MPSTVHISRLLGTKLAEFLSSATWDGGITSSEWVYRRTPDYQLEDLASLKCSVIPGPVSAMGQTITRGGAVMLEVHVGVLIGKQVANDDEIAALEDLTMQAMLKVREFNEQIDGLAGGYSWTEISQPSPFDRQSLMDNGVFLSQIEVVYEVPFDSPDPPLTFGG